MISIFYTSLYRVLVGKLLLNFYEKYHTFLLINETCETSCRYFALLRMNCVYFNTCLWNTVDVRLIRAAVERECFLLCKLLCMYFLQPAMETYNGILCYRVCDILMGCMGLHVVNNNTIMNPVCPLHIITIISCSYHYICPFLIAVSI